MTDVTPFTITVQWGPVSCIHQNRVITGYSVRYGEVANSERDTFNITVASTTETTISSLMSSTNYSIEVAAVNSAGTGVYSDAITVQTSRFWESLLYYYSCCKSLAGAALSVSVDSTSDTSLTISWDLVDSVTATTFTISYSSTNTNCFTDADAISAIAGSETMYTLTGLEEGTGTEYSITLTATLIGGGGTEQDTITAITMAAGESTSLSSLSLLFSTSQKCHLSVVHVVEDFRKTAVSANSLTLSWSHPSIAAHLTTSYNLTCVPLLAGIPVPQSLWLSPTTTSATVTGLRPVVLYN